jgi:hypothetical protein
MPTLRQLEAHFTKHYTKVETWKIVKPGIDPLKGDWKDEDFT